MNWSEAHHMMKQGYKITNTFLAPGEYLFMKEKSEMVFSNRSGQVQTLSIEAVSNNEWKAHRHSQPFRIDEPETPDWVIINIGGKTKVFQNGVEIGDSITSIEFSHKIGCIPQVATTQIVKSKPFQVPPGMMLFVNKNGDGGSPVE